MNPDTTSIAGYSKTVGADAEVFLDQDNKPVTVSEENPLPVRFLNGFVIPPHNDIEFGGFLQGTNKPQYIIFRLNGIEVAWFNLSYDGNGNLTRIQPD